MDENNNEWIEKITGDTRPQYIRPEVPEETRKKIYLAARKITNMYNHQKLLAYMLAIMVENAQLVAEVNAHRAARGFALLPVFDPEVRK